MSYFITQKALDLLLREYFSVLKLAETKTPTEKSRNPYWQQEKFNLKQLLLAHHYEPVLMKINLSHCQADYLDFQGISLFRLRVHADYQYLTTLHHGMISRHST